MCCCFCWLLVAFYKQRIMKCLYLKFMIYLAHDLLSQARDQKKRQLSLPKITQFLDAQADRPTTVKGRFHVKNDINLRRKLSSMVTTYQIYHLKYHLPSEITWLLVTRFQNAFHQKSDQTSKRSLTGTQLNSIYLPVWSCQWVAMTWLQKLSKSQHIFRKKCKCP